MLIEFKRSGGFAGLMIDKTIDTDNLDPKTAQRARELVKSSGFFDLPIRIPGSGADRFQYNLTIDVDERRHSVQVAESSIPPKLDPLIRWLEDR